ncbi:MAG: hypothetical protein FWC62_00535 [Firmicutes bacterium]|nr:hypothetical protein [Bacillota bacterium]
MRKTWVMLITTAVVGALGMFLRWLQMQNVLKDEVVGGNHLLLVARSSSYSTAVVVAIACFVGLAILFTLWLRKGLSVPKKPAPLSLDRPVQTVLAGLSCVLLLIFAVLMLPALWNGEILQKLVGLLAFVVLVAFAAAVARLTLVKGSFGGKYFAALCAAFSAVAMSVWLIFLYKENAEEPQLWLFVPGILAIASAALSFYYLAGYAFGRVKPGRALLLTQLGVYFNLMAAVYPGEPAQTGTARTFLFLGLALFFFAESWAVAEQKE